jgi:hypothetical protein
MEILNILKDLINKECSLYSISFTTNKDIQKCKSAFFQNDSIMLDSSENSSEEINELGDLYLVLIKYKIGRIEYHPTFFSKENNKENIYNGLYIDHKKKTIIFTWHADLITYHF